LFYCRTHLSHVTDTLCAGLVMGEYYCLSGNHLDELHLSVHCTKRYGLEYTYCSNITHCRADALCSHDKADSISSVLSTRNLNITLVLVIKTRRLFEARRLRQTVEATFGGSLEAGWVQFGSAWRPILKRRIILSNLDTPLSRRCRVVDGPPLYRTTVELTVSSLFDDQSFPEGRSAYVVCYSRQP